MLGAGGQAGGVLQLGGCHASNGGIGGARWVRRKRTQCAGREGCAAEGAADRGVGNGREGQLDAAMADAGAKEHQAARARLPHSTDPIIAIAAKDGFGAVAGQSLQLANGETVTLSGQDTQFVTGGQMRVHSGQAIGVLGGAVKAGEGGIGLQLIAAKDAIDMQAQADELKVQARDEVNVISANAHIDWAAAKKISLSTAGGANITIEGGNITVQCPGKIKVHAGKKSFPKSNATIAPFQAIATQDPSLNWYAIADSAQHKDLPNALLKNGAQARCLLGAPQDSPVARHAPHLVSLESPLEAGSVWSWIHLNVRKSPCLSIIASHMPFDIFFEKIASFTEVVMPDGDSMVFAFWDPAILGTLMGQPDDLTLHVRGPVLNFEQQSAFVRGVSGWWYWDRGGDLHGIAATSLQEENVLLPIVINQCQVDELIEASVPDHVIYYLRQNQTEIMADVPTTKLYGVVSQSLKRARYFGLQGMRDLVDFVCVELVYKEQMKNNPAIVNLLEQVRLGNLDFQAAIHEMP
jgi:uncharacterized protein (DUF2345 family)